ncbi:hypothetical protein BBO99_00003402 [Phytophthora kernoviae]|uniref:Uncharacterized protein n=2 Tax=Phytophthora kernoviae TaxID=325452 RepID=A0A3R7HK86_9STRA|nr:hypothetical protein G195_003792 [Phytophthora kernoviae 00238/432]KAG2531950.1 hypothetical protein JM16_000581 [Phytophthora kernoviae]KAG2532286.1 hypothetical protein JM18_000710 [Phytophthora kernoviae]RLN25798.1 hypothetical protein BBI17_003041 [Phytophthora kernoviae]RLN81801.1 hypothetical protein BBO99_00003402 [Phytophthora kernoviae]
MNSETEESGLQDNVDVIPEQQHLPIRNGNPSSTQVNGKPHGIKSLSEEEVEHLPEQFVPAMDMMSYMVTSTATHLIGTTGGTATALAATMSTGIPVALDVNPYMNVMHPQQTFVPSSAASLQEAVNTVHELNAQLERFENDMAMKLDYLDDRVSKLCYLVLPPRLS